MKKLIFAFLLLLSCSSPTEPVIKTANVHTTIVKQPYYDILETYGLLEVYYQIENTGNADIEYYEVYFKVSCADGSVFYDWDNGLGLMVGSILSDYTVISTAGKQVTGINITEIHLE